MKPRLSTQDIAKAAKAVGLDAPALIAVTRVEAPGGGFLPSGNPVILYERHKMWKRLTSRGLDPSLLNKAHPDLCYPHWVEGFHYGSEAYQWVRIATVLDWARNHQQPVTSYEKAAYEASSWGLYQVLGENFAACGFENVLQFKAAMEESEARQLEVAVKFMQHEGLIALLARHDWEGFSERWNGPGKVKDYSGKLRAAFTAAGGR